MTALRLQAAGLSLSDAKQAMLLRDILENAVLLQLRRGDSAAFERLMTQVRLFLTFISTSCLMCYFYL